MSDSKVSLLDRLLAIPVAVYFWWYEWRQKIRERIKTFFRHRVYRLSYEGASRSQNNPDEYRQTEMRLKPIGIVKTELNKLSLAFQNGDLECEEGRYHPKVHPGGRKDYPLVGVFATRLPARPNPICVTTAELLERKGNVLKVRGLDAVDGSPLVDIKPHLPSYDAPSNVRLPDWVKALTSYFLFPAPKQR